MLEEDQQSIDAEVKKIKEMGRRDLAKSAGACVFLATFFYLLYYYLLSQGEELEWAAHLAQHLSVAFTVGLISIVGLEFNARRRAERLEQIARERAERDFARFLAEVSQYKEQISLHVFDAVLRQFVPESFVKEITEILRLPIVKKDCKYRLTFLKPLAGMQAGYCILQRETEFILQNLLESPKDFTLRSLYYATDLIPPPLRDSAFHNALFVNRQRVPMEESAQSKSLLERTIALKPKEEVHVLLRGEGPARISTGGYSYIQQTPADGLEISIDNRCGELISEVTVQMFHPAGEGEHVKYSPDVAPQYVLRRAFLPGQGFEVRWKGVETEEALPPEP